jgi:hypothetical protein
MNARSIEFALIKVASAPAPEIATFGAVLAPWSWPMSRSPVEGSSVGVPVEARLPGSSWNFDSGPT